MIPDQLFEAAIEYRKTKLWNVLSDHEIFAVQHADGEIGYCCVMGMIGELTALAVYPGQAGLDSLRMLTDDMPLFDELAQFEHMRSQDCVMVSFEVRADLPPRDLAAAQDYGKRNGVAFCGRNAFPHFERFRPGYERWYLEDEDDQRRMLDGLQAAVELARRLQRSRWTNFITDGALYGREIPLLIPEGDGWRLERHPLPPRAEITYPTAPLTDDLTRARLMKGKRAGQWAAKFFRYSTPISDEGGNDMIPFDDLTQPPYYPMTLMVVNAANGMVHCMELADDPVQWVEDLGNAFLKTIAKDGLPTALLVEDDRTEAVFGPLCAQLGIRLERREEIEPLDAVLDEFLERFGDGEGDTSELEEMFEVLRIPGALEQLPDEMIAQSLPLLEMGILPDDIAENLRREIERRGL